jgi:hypothetical protein
MTRRIAGSIAAVALLALLSSCATTKINLHTVGLKPPLCRAMTGSQAALVLWGAAWRENQKEVLLREEMASRAISNFFREGSCYSKVTVLRSLDGRQATTLSDAEVLKLSTTLSERYRKIIQIRLEELGPILSIYLSPILWEGGTEVLLRVRVLDVDSASLETDLVAHWRNSGAFVLKGTGSLEDDLQSALKSIFGESQAAVKR